MPGANLWTRSQREAWSYVKGAANSGLRQVEALREYREGGGSIRTSSWGELWDRYQSGAAEWDRLYQFNNEDTIPRSMFSEVNIQYADRYTMTFKTTVRNIDGEITHDIYRQVSSDRLLTMGQWQQAAVETMYDDPSVPTMEVLEIGEVEFYERVEGRE